jgi:hypothetical protein
LIALLTDART